MRSFRWLFALVTFFLLFAGPAAVLASAADDKGEEPRALLQSVDPTNCRPGDTVVATGERLTAKYLAELYLTNGKDDFKVEILKQTDTQVTFKVPANLNGRFRLMILTAGVDPKLAEQPVRITVE